MENLAKIAEMVDLAAIKLEEEKPNEKNEGSGKNNSEKISAQTKPYAEPLTSGSHDSNGNIIEKDKIGDEKGAVKGDSAGKGKDKGEKEEEEKTEKEKPEEKPEEKKEEKKLEAKIPEAPPEQEEKEQAPPPKDGIYEYTDDDGKLNILEYKEGKLNGTIKVFTPGGEIETEAEFKDDVLNGICKTYEKGKLVTESGFKDGVINGEFKQFDENEKMISQITFENGIKKGDMIENHKNGNPSFVTHFEDDKKNGKLEMYNENNEMTTYCEYKNDELNGITKNYYSGLDGNGIMRVANYEDGKISGQEDLFYPTGAPMAVGQYENGSLTEPIKSFKNKK